MTEEQYKEKAKFFADRLGIDWADLVAEVEMCNFIRAVALEWVFNNRGAMYLGGGKKLKADMNSLACLPIDKQKQAFLNMGYELPPEIANNNHLFFDFWDMVRSVLSILPSRQKNFQ